MSKTMRPRGFTEWVDHIAQQGANRVSAYPHGYASAAVRGTGHPLVHMGSASSRRIVCDAARALLAEGHHAPL